MDEFGNMAWRTPPSRAEKIALLHAVQAGDDGARERLVEANRRLLVPVAKTYRRAAFWKRLDFASLEKAGPAGLREAIDGYDSDQGYRFFTYATYRIRQAILRKLGKG